MIFSKMLLELNLARSDIDKKYFRTAKYFLLNINQKEQDSHTPFVEVFLVTKYCQFMKVCIKIKYSSMNLEYLCCYRFLILNGKNAMKLFEIIV